VSKAIVFLIVLHVITLPVKAQPGSGRVSAVIDGNTVEVVDNANETFRITLADIDCPELSQPYGVEARQFLGKMLSGKEVKITWRGKDRKGNHIAVVLLAKDVDPRIQLIREGLAWTSEKNPDAELESLRMEAQRNGKGLWKERNATPPWIYRRQQSMMNPKSS
jgi:endonuclease YncB( thermonuclease family)